MDKIDWNNPEEVCAYHKEYRERNKERIQEYNKRYREKNREKILIRTKAWRERNKDKINEKQRKYRVKFREKIREQQKEYFKKNKEKIKKFYKERRNKAIDKLGGKCVVCGWTDKRALVFDHVKDDGYKDKKGGKTGRLITWILKTPVEEVKKKIQILCKNHNGIKQREKEEFGF